MFFEAPPLRRKVPKQTRSRIMVDSIKESCREILVKDGSCALTVIRLTEKAGIEIGSFYQYYPNIDSVVGEIFADEVSTHLRQHLGQMVCMPEASLREVLRYTIEAVVAFHRRLFALNQRFYIKYKRSYRLTDHCNIICGDNFASHTEYMDLLERANLPASADFDRLIFVIDNCIENMIEASIFGQPQYLGQQRFVDQIISMCLAAINDEREACGGQESTC